MSFLQEQIKDLKNKQLKADFYRLIKTKIGDIQDQQFKDTEKEVKDSIFSFIDSHIDMIESNEIRESSELRGSLNEDELLNLKLILNDSEFLLALINRGKTKKISNQETLKIKQQVPIPVQNTDKVGFSLQHRHLDGRKVIVDDAGVGKVVGLDAPFIVVSLDSGQTINVPVGKFQVTE